MKTILSILLTLPFYCMAQADIDTTYMIRIGDSILIKKNPNILLFDNLDNEQQDCIEKLKEKDEEIEDLKWFVKRWKTIYYETQNELDKLKSDIKNKQK